MLSILFAPLKMLFSHLRKHYLFIKIQSRNYDRRFEAVYAIEKEYGPKAVTGLIYILQHKNPEIRNDVAYTLELITGKHNGDSYKTWSKWWKTNKERIMKKYFS